MAILFITLTSVAILGGLPAIVALAYRTQGHWRGWAVALVVAPYAALIMTQWIWPIGGLSNFAVNLMGLIAAVFVAQCVLLLPRMRYGQTWSRLILLSVVLLSTAPIHLAFPPLPD